MNGPAIQTTSVPGFFVGGFECSSHRVGGGRRLDLLSSTRHLEFVRADYERLAEYDIGVAREGLVWHRIEPAPGERDWSTLLPLVRAAREQGVRVIWDLLHFGWPDHVDVFAPAFVDAFARLARDFARVLADETDEVPWICPVNEISFLSWAGADVAAIHPFTHARGFELKCQLVRASLVAIDAVRAVHPRVRIVIHDPAFHVVADPERPHEAEAAEVSRQLQFQATDMLAGRTWPQLGGAPDVLDVIGVNYYPWNQWTFGTPLQPGRPIRLGDARYKPLSEMLVEWHARYARPIYVGETGCEGDARAGWLRSVCDQVAISRERGAVVDGVCLYPIVNFPGWDNDRHCENGLWDYADDLGCRAIHEPLALELREQQRRFGTRRRIAATASAS